MKKFTLVLSVALVGVLAFLLMSEKSAEVSNTLVEANRANELERGEKSLEREINRKSTTSHEPIEQIAKQSEEDKVEVESTSKDSSVEVARKQFNQEIEMYGQNTEHLGFIEDKLYSDEFAEITKKINAQYNSVECSESMCKLTLLKDEQGMKGIGVYTTLEFMTLLEVPEGNSLVYDESEDGFEIYTPLPKS